MIHQPTPAVPPRNHEPGSPVAPHNLNNFNIETGNSGAENIGKSGVLPLIDLNGTSRSNPPDAGAYETTIFPED